MNVTKYEYDMEKSMNLGKLEYFTNLNILAIEGDDSPRETIIYGFRSIREVVIKFTQMN